MLDYDASQLTLSKQFVKEQKEANKTASGKKNWVGP
jgi:hypothetical protein